MIVDLTAHKVVVQGNIDASTLRAQEGCALHLKRARYLSTAKRCQRREECQPDHSREMLPPRYRRYYPPRMYCTSYNTDCITEHLYACVPH